VKFLVDNAPGTPGFGVYVHWPFCAGKCPYCDFNSHVRAAIDEAGWLSALLRELNETALWLGRDRSVVSTIFFGGGTPSLMSGKSVGRVIDEIARLWPRSNDLEITLEANPASVDAARFRDYRDAGVNRISIGMQALNDADLKRLGRLHTVAEAKAALGTAMRSFDRVSVDLIYARPEQTPRTWKAELEEAVGFGTEHLSLYQLTIEPATPFAALHRSGELKVPDDDAAANLYELTQEIAEKAGLPAYEISNHARPGAEARHNLIYWRYGSYAGVGPGAHGRLVRDGKRYETATERLPERWQARVSERGSGISETIEIALADQAREHLLMALRLSEGIDTVEYDKRWNVRLDRARIADLEEKGLVAATGDRLRATRRGRLLLNSIIAELAV
jgi:oxygen-independent coproporphyrinogen-3 oxidase